MSVWNRTSGKQSSAAPRNKYTVWKSVTLKNWIGNRNDHMVVQSRTHDRKSKKTVNYKNRLRFSSFSKNSSQSWGEKSSNMPSVEMRVDLAFNELTSSVCDFKLKTFERLTWIITQSLLKLLKKGHVLHRDKLNNLTSQLPIIRRCWNFYIFHYLSPGEEKCTLKRNHVR